LDPKKGRQQCYHQERWGQWRIEGVSQSGVVLALVCGPADPAAAGTGQDPDVDESADTDVDEPADVTPEDAEWKVSVLG